MTSFAMVEGVTVEEMTAAMTTAPPAKEPDVEVRDGVAKRPRRKPEAKED